MISALYITGAAAFVISAAAGFSSGSVVEFFIFMAGGISSANILFALAKILENQENILYQLMYREEAARKFFSHKKKVCSKCNYEYDNDCSSCPYCGYRD